MRIRARIGTNNRMVDQLDGENLIIHRSFELIDLEI